MSLRQSRNSLNVQPVLGLCYGNTPTSYLHGYLKVVGQNFWTLISGNKDLFTEIVEPIRYGAREHDEKFYTQKAAAINRFTLEFINRFCDESGKIDWIRLVEFNSGNYDLDKFIS